ncbi:hypothetical protein [Pseudomonas defluvii]
MKKTRTVETERYTLREQQCGAKLDCAGILKEMSTLAVMQKNEGKLHYF